MDRRNGPLIDEEKEQKAIAWENKVLSFLMPIVGLIAFVMGLIGFILVVKQNVGVAIFLIVLAALGLGGVAYGVVEFIKKRAQRKPKENEAQEEQK